MTVTRSVIKTAVCGGYSQVCVLRSHICVENVTNISFPTIEQNIWILLSSFCAFDIFIESRGEQNQWSMGQGSKTSICRTQNFWLQMMRFCGIPIFMEISNGFELCFNFYNFCLRYLLKCIQQMGFFISLCTALDLTKLR